MDCCRTRSICKADVGENPPARRSVMVFRSGVSFDTVRQQYSSHTKQSLTFFIQFHVPVCYRMRRPPAPTEKSGSNLFHFALYLSTRQPGQIHVPFAEMDANTPLHSHPIDGVHLPGGNKILARLSFYTFIHRTQDGRQKLPCGRQEAVLFQSILRLRMAPHQNGAKDLRDLNNDQTQCTASL